MKIIETDGIVIKTMDFKENDSILTFLTPDSGKIAGVLHGGKSARTGNAAKAELFVTNHFELSVKPNIELVRIRKCELLESYHQIRRNYSKFLHTSYISELLLLCEIPAVESKDYYNLLHSTIIQLSKSAKIAEIKFEFEVQLLKLLGISPNLESCIQCGGSLWRNTSGNLLTAKFSVPYQLDASQGGIRCPNCCIRSSFTNALHPGSLAYFHNRQTGMGSGIEISPTQISLKELAQAVYVYLSHFFGRNLKSYTLLKENS